jgi:hemoglobin
MILKKEIESREDIELLVDEFYKKVRKDEVLSYIFNEAIEINWEEHMPIMADFWESIILDNPIYHRNAMHVHMDLNQKVPLKHEHFEQWKNLFFETLKEYFSGPRFPELTKRIESIASLMEYKVSNSDPQIL